MSTAVKRTRMKCHQIECEYTPEIVCPYCGYRYRDSWAVSADMRDGDEDGLQCSGCGKDFTFALNLAVTYSTRKQEKEEER